MVRKIFYPLIKFVNLILLSIIFNGCTVLGFHSGKLIDESFHYTIEKPDLEKVKIEVGTPVTIHLKSNEILSGNFSKITFGNDSLYSDSSVISMPPDSFSTISQSDSIPPDAILTIFTGKHYVHIPGQQISSIDVKPYTYVTLLTMGLGMILDIAVISMTDLHY
jgi:hypothetical protein